MLDYLSKIVLVSGKGTMWKSFKDQSLTEKHELIELGVCFLDLKTLNTKALNYIIKPESSKISKFCTKRTGLTQGDVNRGQAFETVSRELLTSHFVGDYVCAGWGTYIRKQIKKQCEDKKIPFPFSGNYLNIQMIFSLFMGLDKESSLSDALGIMFPNEKFKSLRAMDDVINMAKIVQCMMQKLRYNVPR